MQESDLPAWVHQENALRRPMPTAGDGIYDALVAEFGRTQREGALALEGGTMVAGPAMLSRRPLNREDSGSSSDMSLRGVADPARNRELEKILSCKIPPKVGSEKWLKTATLAELYANGYQTTEQYDDPARDLRSAQALALRRPRA
ncbi:hypothetical protein [Achromobacter xylosoxidans]|uniref:hypothetical protein n=1 Tax=Alcaligenes xylosoxydans xylosoxydans TaxID=85698 RepID=UPI001566E102|nr:hypothetical protein [Achromobacter xylosoxidans]QKI68338.1 hypothetical protein HPS44_01070 [Achromobacter xylosoxidans]